MKDNVDVPSGDSANNDYGNVEEQMIPGRLEGADSAAKKRSGRAERKAGGTARRRLRKKRSSSSTDTLIKYGALFLLVAQMVGLVLLMRMSRTSHVEGQPMYLASTAVFTMELMKLVICLCVIAYQSETSLVSELTTHVVNAPMEIAKLSIPSFMYTVQNNLLYFALSNLDAATYQVCYQLKILTTAVFSMILLQRKFSLQKWASLILLTLGVSVVEVSSNHDDTKSEDEKQSQFIGLIAVLCAACTSGFSGVYFEKVLKGSQTSLWLRNVQMGIPSIIIAFITVYAKDYAVVSEQGFLGGYTSLVWTVVIVQAVGGLIVAVVVKYADNVMKVFATSFSIVVSCIISAIFFDFHASWAFTVGASLVVISTVLYAKPERKRTRKSVLPDKVSRK